MSAGASDIRELVGSFYTVLTDTSSRHSYFEEGCSVSEIAKLQNVDRKTVRKYVNKEDFNEPVVSTCDNRKYVGKLTPFKPIIDEWLEEDKQFRKKQRHTARRVYDRLCVEEPEFSSSYRAVAEYVREKKGTLYQRVKPSLPLAHYPGEAQVDFGEADFFENGKRITGKYFNLTFPYSNAGYMQLCYGENLECLLESLQKSFHYYRQSPLYFR